MTKRDAIAAIAGAMVMAFALGIFFGSDPVMRWVAKSHVNIGDATL